MVNANAQSLSGIQIFVPMDYSPPDSSVHRIFQARILEWVAIFWLLPFKIFENFASSFCNTMKWSEVKVTQLCLTFCEPMECIVHGIL